ncbi:oxidoreductase [Salipaludibacillus keqinensis]|uniref:Oxidoreductase n=1 Tax=Salipaludibacillus keqinensis TaxID=2045207 RepID=A0A323TKC0_9BACI|nr:SDR family oxidoreductase [Salipaludibacillus keqinensis]PYZ94404.1 oxidoreductase [Salipaludibacillus keqinensis]
MTGKALTKELVVITGASSGIGKEMAIEVANRGGVPILLARSEEKMAAISDQIYLSTNIIAPYYILDVSNNKEVKKVFDTIIEKHGTINVLINNAGFAVFDSVLNASMEDAEDMFQVNVLGTIACTKAILPHMLKNKSGHIIFVASQAAKLSTPKASVYAATKHALLGFANGLRMEVHDDPITISVVNPGPIRTGFLEAADKTGNYQKSVEKFLLDANDVAKKTIQLIARPRRELNLPLWMGVGSMVYQLFPQIVERIAGKQLRQK